MLLIITVNVMYKKGATVAKNGTCVGRILGDDVPFGI